MSLLQYAGRLYSLDTLDSRFTTSSKTPPSRIDPAKPSPDEAGYRKGRAGNEDVAKGPSPPRWRSQEFMYHGLIFLVMVPLMFKTVYDVSKCKQPDILHVVHCRLTPYTKLHIRHTPNFPISCHQDGYLDARSTVQINSTQAFETMYHTYW